MSLLVQLLRPTLPQVGDPNPERRAELLRQRTAIEQILARFVLALNALIGASPIVDAVTLAAGPATTTTILDARILATSRIVLFPATAAGAAALPGLYVSAVAAGSITLTHLAAATTRTFHYAIFP